jgi:thiol:disulfide interchange protein DsbG
LAEHEEYYDDGGIRPLERVPDAIRSQIQSNTALMIGLGLQGTPTLIFQDKEGRWRVAPGMIGEADLRQQVFQLH